MKVLIGIVFVSLPMLSGSIVPGSAFEVVGTNGAHATIVIPDKSQTMIVMAPEYAAQELQYHVRESTGAILPIVHEDQRPAGTGLIFLGACQQTKSAGVDTSHLAPNAFIIRLVDDDLFIAGEDFGQVFGSDPNKGPWNTVIHYPTRIGTLFGVYEFLEKQLGVKWLWPGKSGEVIPRHAEVNVESWEQTWTPPFRATYVGDNPYRVNIFEPGRWSSPEALDTYLHNQVVWLRRQRFAQGESINLIHSFKDWWTQYGATNPKFFNLLPDDTRRSDPTVNDGHPSHLSMCVSQPALWAKITENWRASRSGWDPFIQLGENDNPGKCTCPDCMAWDESEAPANERLTRAKQAFTQGDSGWVAHLGSLSDRYAKFYLAVQKEAQKTDPNATVLGFAYENYVSPPRHTKLNSRVIISFVPRFIFPWTDEVREQARREWEGWSKTGASMFLRPNWLLAGHNMPLFYARKLGEDLNYFAAHGMVATTFDSLTGDWSTQGPNLYVLARLQIQPGRPVDEVLDEYYSGFGKAREAVKNYFRHWEDVSDAVTDEAWREAVNARPRSNAWRNFLLLADMIFAPQVMERGRDLLSEAERAARGEPGAEERVAFLERGLRKAEMTLGAQAAFRHWREGGDRGAFTDAMAALDAYRRSVDTKDTDNVSWSYWFENLCDWDRSLIGKQ